MKRFLNKTGGFTLVELLVAAGIFMVSMIVMTSAGVNLYRDYKRQLARDTLYEETRALSDRVVQEIRENTIDFDEYYNHMGAAQGGGGSVANYGEYYRGYYHHFFYVTPPAHNASPCSDLGLNDPDRYAYSATDPCRAQDVNEGYFSTGADNVADPGTAAGISPLNGVHELGELYLISADGKHKAILKKLPLEDGHVALGILKLDLKDQYDNGTLESGTPQGDPDGYYDCWANNIDFPAREFIPISPPSMTITDVKFFVSPIDDPWKAFNESDVQVQVHPIVTILLTTEATAEETRSFSGVTPPNLTIQTTASSRIYDNVQIPFASDGTGGTGTCLTSLPIPTGGIGGEAEAPAPVCGNNVRETGEDCDGSDLGGQTCVSISGAYTGGSLSCNSDCTLNTSACVTGCQADPKRSGKCVICHVSGGSCNTQSVSPSGRSSHLNGGHGDFDGACLSESPPCT